MMKYTKLLFILILQMSAEGKNICYLPKLDKNCDLSKLHEMLQGKSETCMHCDAHTC